MCMKNINTDVVFFESATLSSQSESGIDIFQANKGAPLIEAKQRNAQEMEIPTLRFMLSINANERKDDPLHDPNDTPEDTIFFNQKYIICLRLTEPQSGKFTDLETFDFTPEDEQIVLCRKIYAKKLTYQCQNIVAAIPPQQKDMCVLKVLVKLSDPAVKKWYVQSIHPIHIKLQKQGE